MTKPTWNQRRIATLPTGEFDSLRVVALTPSDEPFFIGQKSHRRHPVLGATRYPALETVDLAALSPEGLPTCVGKDGGSLVVQRGDERRALPYPGVCPDDGLFFWKGKETFVVYSSERDSRDRRVLLHGGSPLEIVDMISALSVGSQGHLAYANRVCARGWQLLIRGDGDSYREYQFPDQNLLGEVVDVPQFCYDDGIWHLVVTLLAYGDGQYLVMRCPGDPIDDGAVAGGTQICVDCLSVYRGELICVQRDERSSAVVWGYRPHIPLVFVFGHDQGIPRQLLMADDVPTLLVADDKAAGYATYGDERSPQYDEVLKGSLKVRQEGDDREISFIARKGPCLYRVLRRF